ncbi:MAG: pirin family protein, partial [Anaerolineales bacterium]
HRDSLGNSGLIGSGDVQWMTAGGGILHEEMPRRGPDGIINGFQLWVNLPAAQKMSRPRYQGVEASTIPLWEKEGCQVYVIAGMLGNVRGPVMEIAANPVYLDVALAAGATFNVPVPEKHTCLAYIFNGQGLFGDQEIEGVKMVVFGSGDQVEVRTGSSPLRFILVAGSPIGEPIVPYGPFVMNTKEEIQQALADLKNGTFVQV